MATDRNMNTNCFLFEFYMFFLSLLIESTSKHFNCFYATVWTQISSFIWMPVRFFDFVSCTSPARPLNVKMCVIKCCGAGALCGNKLINSQLTAHGDASDERLNVKPPKVITNRLPCCKCQRHGFRLYTRCTRCLLEIFLFLFAFRNYSTSLKFFHSLA